MTSVNPHQHVIDAGIVPGVLSKLSFMGDKLTRTAQDAIRLGGREVATVALALAGAAAMIAPTAAQAQQQPWEIALQQQQQKYEKDMQRQRQSQALQTGVQIAGQLMGATNNESSLARLAGEIAGASTTSTNNARNASAGAQLLALGAQHLIRDKAPQQPQYQANQFGGSSYNQQYQYQPQQQNSQMYAAFSQRVQPAYSAVINHHMEGNEAQRDQEAHRYFNLVVRATTAGVVLQPNDRVALQEISRVVPHIAQNYLATNARGEVMILRP